MKAGTNQQKELETKKKEKGIFHIQKYLEQTKISNPMMNKKDKSFEENFYHKSRSRNNLS